VNNDFVHTASDHGGLNISENGFAAMLRGDNAELDLPGIIGCPRVNPTGTGLWIEDSHPAAIDEVIIAILEDFVRREGIDNHFELTDRSGLGYRDTKRHTHLNKRNRERERQLTSVG
jgi:hypothetical protein